MPKAVGKLETCCFATVLTMIVSFVKADFFTMNAKYLKRYEAVFLVHPAKESKLSYTAAAVSLRKSKAFVEKWINALKK